MPGHLIVYYEFLVIVPIIVILLGGSNRAKGTVKLGQGWVEREHYSKILTASKRAADT
jgi:hypothetical protein